MNEIMWMVRAGEGAYLIEEFEKGYIAIGWNDIGDLSNIKNQEEIKKYIFRNILINTFPY